MSDAAIVSRSIGDCRIELVLGNIVQQQADAIVNAANTKLSGGGGVDGAIHRAAGKILKEACQRCPADEQGRRCPTGEVRVTEAGRLRAKVVLHAVGPFYNARYADKADRQLRQLHENILRAALEHECNSVALPAISTGAYRFPIQRAAAVALQAVTEFLKQQHKPEVVRFVLFKQAHRKAFQQALDQVDPGG
jgi:O-acetyl-ADP-ribose deacetylase (regulator of RNase III)